MQPSNIRCMHAPVGVVWWWCAVLSIVQTELYRYLPRDNTVEHRPLGAGEHAARACPSAPRGYPVVLWEPLDLFVTCLAAFLTSTQMSKVVRADCVLLYKANPSYVPSQVLTGRLGPSKGVAERPGKSPENQAKSTARSSFDPNLESQHSCLWVSVHMMSKLHSIRHGARAWHIRKRGSEL